MARTKYIQIRRDKNDEVLRSILAARIVLFPNGVPVGRGSYRDVVQTSCELITAHAALLDQHVPGWRDLVDARREAVTSLVSTADIKEFDDERQQPEIPASEG